ncbi:MAG: NAD(P)H-binding protein [Opitutaceae bacterium]|nr:NAD(P)H-binding protein [Opitutaceae bacterium]
MNTNEAIQVLVVGASGATGRLLVEELLARGCRVKAIVRSPECFPESMTGNETLSLIHASVLDLSDADMAVHASDCVAVVSCLGHTLSLRASTDSRVDL